MSNIILKNKYTILIYTIALASFVVNLDTYVINVSLPIMAEQFNTTTTAISWVTLAYNLTVVSLLLIFGNLGDKIGLKKLFIIGFAIFGISSLCCGIAFSLKMLVISRLLQGVGAAILYALPQAMIAKYLPEEKRGMAFGILASAAALGITLGAPLSGLLSGLLSWRFIFFINIPFVIFAIIFFTRILPKDIFSSTSKKPFDFAGAVLSFCFALSFTFYLNQGIVLGWNSGIMHFLLALSIIFFILFVLRINTYKFPLLSPALFANINFSLANAAMLFVSILLSGSNFIMPFFLAQKMQLTSIQIGGVIMIYSVSYMISSIISGKLSKYVSAKILSSIAMVLYSLNAILFVTYINSHSLLFTFIFLALSGVSFSFFITSNNNYVMSMSNQTNTGMIAGTHRMVGRLGMLLGVVVFESIFANYVHISNEFAFKAVFTSCLIFSIITLFCTVFTPKKQGDGNCTET